jgi:hypothetical protein
MPCRMLGVTVLPGACCWARRLAPCLPLAARLAARLAPARIAPRSSKRCACSTLCVRRIETLPARSAISRRACRSTRRLSEPWQPRNRYQKPRESRNPRTRPPEARASRPHVVEIAVILGLLAIVALVALLAWPR